MSIIDTQFEEAKHRLATEFDELIQLRPLPQAAVKIIEACRDKNLKISTLVDIVECDSVITGRLLSVVNSSLYGYSREVSSIQQAIVVLGRTNLSNMSVAIASEAVFSSGDETGDAKLRLYEHSLACASISRLIAQINQADSGEAFLSGMLHDVGKLLLLDIAPSYFQLNLDVSELEVTTDLERQMFGFDHAEIGAKIGKSWGLSQKINRVIAEHHQTSMEIQPLQKTTSIANKLAKAWGIGQSQTESLDEDAAQWLEKLTPEAAEKLKQEATESFAEIQSLLTG